MAELLDRAFTPDEAREVAAWSYDPPFDFYNLSGEAAVALVTTHDELGHGYYPLKFDEELVGFVCFGPEARVQGQSQDTGTCDIGMGLQPDRVSQGIATQAMPMIIAFAAERFAAERLRAAVAAFNERSLRLCTSAGFRRLREFDGPKDQTFIELILDLSSEQATFSPTLQTAASIGIHNSHVAVDWSSARSIRRSSGPSTARYRVGREPTPAGCW